MHPTSENNTRHLAKTASLGFCCGLIVWIALLVASAQKLRKATDIAHTTVHIGGVRLTEISKQTNDRLQMLQLHFDTGLIWFLASAVVLGVVVGRLYRRFTSQRHARSS